MLRYQANSFGLLCKIHIFEWNYNDFIHDQFSFYILPHIYSIMSWTISPAFDPATAAVGGVLIGK